MNLDPDFARYNQIHASPNGLFGSTGIDFYEKLKVYKKMYDKNRRFLSETSMKDSQASEVAYTPPGEQKPEIIFFPPFGLSERDSPTTSNLLLPYCVCQNMYGSCLKLELFWF